VHVEPFHWLNENFIIIIVFQHFRAQLMEGKEEHECKLHQDFGIFTHHYLILLKYYI